MPEPGASPAFAYRAFISYSHRDKAWADWLHKALETWRVPSRLVGTKTAAGVIPRRLTPIFRDRDELASAPDLVGKVNAALEQSANLIVLCSPRAAASPWVSAEVLAFKRLGRSDRIFCLIVDGEPNASETPDHQAEECFVAALRFQLDADGLLTGEHAEPVAADARAGKDGKTNAMLKLIAGLLDVGFDVLKQREQHRRNRRMAAITTMAVVVMAVTSVLAIAALIARHDAITAEHKAVVAQAAAERRQKQAEGLVGFMLGDLSDKLNQVNRLDILESVDDKAMAYFQSLPTSDVTDKSLVQRAKAFERIGSVRLDQGHLPAALESYQASLKLLAAQAMASPHDMSVQLAYAENVAFIGTTHWYQGNLDAAERNFQLAESIITRAEKINAVDLQLLFQKQIVENNLGHILESRGKFDEALLAYQRALALAQQLVVAKPDNAEWVEALGDSHNNLGKLALTRGDLATAIAEYTADDRIETALSARDPRNNDQRHNVLRVRAILGRTLALAGQTNPAIRNLREALSMVSQLMQQVSSLASLQESSALYQMQLSRLLRLSGNLPEAVELTGDSLEVFAALTRQDPANIAWHHEFAEVQTEQAAQSLAGGHLEAARTQVQKALDILDPALEQQTDNRGILLATVNARLLLATAIGGPEAQRLSESCLSAVNSIKSGVDDPRVLALKVEALLALGRKDEALSVIAPLRRSGYRDPAFVQKLQVAQIDYPPDALAEQRLHAAVSGDSPDDAARN